MLAPVSLPAGIATGIILYLAAVGSLSLTAPVIEVRDRMLRAGRATISLDQTGEAVAAFDADARVERGTGLDARAFLVIRGMGAARGAGADHRSGRSGAVLAAVEPPSQRTGRRDQRITTA